VALSGCPIFGTGCEDEIGLRECRVRGHRFCWSIRPESRWTTSLSRFGSAAVIHGGGFEKLPPVLIDFERGIEALVGLHRKDAIS